MAKIVIKNPIVSINGVDLSDHADSATVHTEYDDVDMTCFGATNKEHARGLGDATITIGWFQDFAAGEVDATLWPLSLTDTPFPVNVRPTNGAISATNPEYQMSSLLFNYDPIAGSVGEASKTETEFQNASQTGLVQGRDPVTAVEANSQPQEPAVSVGEAVKATQTGGLPIGTVAQILDRAPSDLVEELLEIPEWDCAVKVRSFTAGQSAMIKQRGLAFKGEDTNVAWAEMEITQFQQGVIEPRFSEEEVRKLHATSGRGFARVIQRLDELSGTDKEELRKAQQEFQDADD